MTLWLAASASLKTPVTATIWYCLLLMVDGAFRSILITCATGSEVTGCLTSDIMFDLEWLGSKTSRR